MTSTKTADKPALDLASLASDPEEVEYTTAEVNVPEEIKAFADHAYKLWQDAPRKWWGKTLSSEDAVAEVKKLARKYAKSQGRTFRSKTVADKTRLVYKVTDAVTRKGKNSDAAN